MPTNTPNNGAETLLSNPTESALVTRTRELFPEVRLNDGYHSPTSTREYLKSVGQGYAGDNLNAIVKPTDSEIRLLIEEAKAVGIDPNLPPDPTASILSEHMQKIHEHLRLKKLVGGQLTAAVVAWEGNFDKPTALKTLSAYMGLILARQEARAEEEITHTQKPESQYSKDKEKIARLEEQANKLAPEEFAETIQAGREAAAKIRSELTNKLTPLGTAVSEAESARLRLKVLKQGLASASKNPPPQV